MTAVGVVAIVPEMWSRSEPLLSMNVLLMLLELTEFRLPDWPTTQTFPEIDYKGVVSSEVSMESRW